MEHLWKNHETSFNNMMINEVFTVSLILLDKIGQSFVNQGILIVYGFWGCLLLQ